jgi:Mrp family chromosome partitioning ATPase
VLIDGPPCGTSADTEYISSVSDATALVVALNATKQKTLENALKQLDSVPAKLIGVIENKVRLDEYRHHMKDFSYYGNKWYKRTKRRSGPVKV